MTSAQSGQYFGSFPSLWWAAPVCVCFSLWFGLFRWRTAPGIAPHARKHTCWMFLTVVTFTTRMLMPLKHFQSKSVFKLILSVPQWGAAAREDISCCFYHCSGNMQKKKKEFAKKNIVYCIYFFSNQTEQWPLVGDGVRPVSTLGFKQIRVIMKNRFWVEIPWKINSSWLKEYDMYWLCHWF